jgi:hypothetical protein
MNGVVWWQCINARARRVSDFFSPPTCFHVDGFGEIAQPRTDRIQVFWDVVPC